MSNIYYNPEGNAEIWDNKPDGYFTATEWNAAHPAPLPPAKPLSEAKAEAKQVLKAYRQQIEYGGFMLNGQRWDSEQKDELRLNSAYKIFEQGVSEYSGWKVSDGVYVTLTPELLQAATMGLMQHYRHAFAVEAGKLSEIDALTSTEEVNAWLENELAQGWEQDD